MRVTVKQLNILITKINKLTASTETTYTKQTDGSLRSNIGNYHLSACYGGYALYRMDNEFGGVDDIFSVGHVTSGRLSDLMKAYIAGLELKNN